jgi:hypothetical protein
MKLPELHAKANNLPYTKAADEDYNSMREGIQGQNGRIHVAFGKPITSLPEVGDNVKKSDLIQHLAETIDNQVHRNYRLWPNAYVAADLLENSEQYSAEYSADDKAEFEARLQKVLEKHSSNQDEMRTLFLKIYANPVFNQKGSRKAEKAG